MSRLGPRDLLGVGLIGIRTRKTRALLSALGISIGIATMVVVTGIPASSQAAAALADLGGAALIGAVAGAYPAMRAARLTPTEALNGT